MNEVTMTTGTEIQKADVSTVDLLTELKPDLLAQKLSPKVRADLDKRASEFVRDLAEADLDSAALDRASADMRELGNRTILNSSTASNRLLEMRETSGRGEQSKDNNTKVAENLVEFRRILENLNPDKRRKFLGMIPYGDKVEDWKRRYESSQDHLESIMGALVQSERDIKLDNQALQLERSRVREQAESLLKVLYLSNELQNRIGSYIQEIESKEPQKALVLQSSVEKDAVQKGNDLKTHALVMFQNYQALQLTINTNEQLVQNLSRARTTTMSSLRGAVLMRQALAQQADVAAQVRATQEMTSDYLLNVSKEVKENAADIERQSQGTMLDLDKLRETYNNIIAATENAEQSRREALSSLKDQRAQLEDFTFDKSSGSLQGEPAQLSTSSSNRFAL